MTTTNPVTLRHLSSPHGSKSSVANRGYSVENIHRKKTKLPSKSISQLDAKMNQQMPINVYSSSSGANLNVSS